jgi:hypothetical protein
MTDEQRLCLYLFDQGGNFGMTLQVLHGSAAAIMTTAMPAKSKLVAYRVYLSAASMKEGKELDVNSRS